MEDSTGLAQPALHVQVHLKRNEKATWKITQAFDKGDLPDTNVGAIGAQSQMPQASSSNTIAAPLLATETNDGGLSLPPRVTGTGIRKSILKQTEPQLHQEPSLQKTVRVHSTPLVRLIPAADDDRTIVPIDYSVQPSDAEHSMSENQRPKLKLSFGKSSTQTPQEPTPSSAVARTPSIKLNLKTPKALPKPALKVKKEPGQAPISAVKKRKRAQHADSSNDEDENSRPAPPTRKLTIKPPPQPITHAPQPQHVPTLKIKYKGKLPKRPVGVGYDSENEETERDPVILEGCILRMQPGPDAEYVRKAISEGTVGLVRAQGGADIQVRMLDNHGRRGLLIVQQRKYATSLVDLPCIVEGMKSWDRKGWIKSIDVCQMLLVLGRCGSDDEARHYPLPPDVDPKTYQYAHGLTAPMRWVRKRRFARTKRARVDDIEAIERRVNALLAADDEALSSSYTLHDHDPREDDAGEESGEYESMDGAEVEEDADTPDDYFASHNGTHGGTVESPKYEEDEIAKLEALFDENDEEDELPAPQGLTRLKDSLHQPEEGSSFAVTSTSASPSATAAHTPATVAEQTSDEDDGEDEEDESGDEDADDAENEGDENRQQALDRIEDMQKKIAEQVEVMKTTENMILKKKIATKIAGLKGDVEQMRRAAGLEEDE